jgi:hypothetical protein
MHGWTPSPAEMRPLTILAASEKNLAMIPAFQALLPCFQLHYQ